MEAVDLCKKNRVNKISCCPLRTIFVADSFFRGQNAGGAETQHIFIYLSNSLGRYRYRTVTVPVPCNHLSKFEVFFYCFVKCGARRDEENALNIHLISTHLWKQLSADFKTGELTLFTYMYTLWSVFRIWVDPDSNCQAGSEFGIRIRGSGSWK